MNARIGSSVFLALFLLQGCSSLFFAPMKQQFITPDRIGINYRDITLYTRDNLQLHGWFLPASTPVKGRVLYLHGNGENISTHIASVYWMPAAGYDVLLLDYRGYGLSAGEPTLPEVLQDVDAAFTWLHGNTLAGQPLIVYGQSLGAALAYQWLSLRQPPDVSAVIYDSVFHSYPAMVRKVLQETWLTWLFSHPVSAFFSSRHDPLHFAAQQPVIPRLFVHSRDDVIVPLAYGKKLYAANDLQACLVESAGPHISFAQQVAGREAILLFLTNPQAIVTGCGQLRSQIASQPLVYIPLPAIQPR